MRHIPIGKTVYKVSDLLSWQRSASLILSPSFQRRPVWKESAKSFLLDTIIRGFPIPIIFLREQVDLKTFEPRREVVDGQQRLRTLFAFIDPSSLSDYAEERDFFRIKKSHNQALAGKGFSDLPGAVQRRILNYEFSTHILPADTDDKEVLQIFARLNSTGVSLKPQEIRNAEFVGPFRNLMYELAYEQLDRWRAWNLFNEHQIARMDEVELTSDLVYMMLYGITRTTQGNLNSVYRKYEEEFPCGPEAGKRFRAVMDSVDETIGDVIAQTQYTRKTLFHSLFTFLYVQRFGETPLSENTRARSLNVTKVRDCVLQVSDLLKTGVLPEELEKTLRGGISDTRARKARFDFLTEHCSIG